MRKKKQTSTICITETDKNRLSWLIETTRERDGVEDREYLDKLEHELERATIVEANAIPADVITMGSKVRLRDLVSGEANIYSLVFPRDADFNQGKISVLAPIGTAILGYRKGDTIEWQVPSGLRRLKVDDVIYQPEAAGHFDP